MSSTEFANISFDLPKNQSNVIKVIGVGGGGSNAINHMFQQGIKGVDFVICNTDAQALDNSPVPNKIQLGVSLTEGLGAGANPQVGEQAAVESFDDIKGMLDSNTKMVFITAGMGGGTGTGAAPIIAKQAKDMDILTVGIVTIPFQFEGKMRCEQAQRGVENLRRQVDSLIVINNNKLREVYGNLGFKAGFSKADEVLATASRGIAEVITHHYTQNIDLRDAKTVLSNSGTAIMGSAQATGGNRANDAIVKALDSPLLNDNKITGAKNVLLLIVSGSEEITIDEIGEINDHIQAEAGHSANIIMGVGEDESLDEAISVTIIATGFDVEQQNEIVNTETKKIIHTLEDEQRAEHNLNPKKTSSNYEAAPPKEDKIVHTLSLKEEEKEEPENDSPSSKVNDMEVEYEEIKHAPSDDFIITEATKDIDVIAPEEVKPEAQEQFMFSFDLPRNTARPVTTQAEENHPEEKSEENTPPEENKIVHHLSDEDEEPEVKESSEKTPEVGHNGVKRYSLEDYMEVEHMLKKSAPAPGQNPAPASRPVQQNRPVQENRSQERPQERPQEKRPVQQNRPTQEDKPVQENRPAPENRPVQENGPESKPTPENKPEFNQQLPEEGVPAMPPREEEIDPFNNPISEDLIQRAAERRAKMKEFNYKFRSNVSKIEDIEKQPAYKRAGIDLDDSKAEEEKLSRTSLGSGKDDEIRFRTNNSFLHDNVD